MKKLGITAVAIGLAFLATPSAPASAAVNLKLGCYDRGYGGAAEHEPWGGATPRRP